MQRLIAEARQYPLETQLQIEDLNFHRAMLRAALGLNDPSVLANVRSQLVSVKIPELADPVTDSDRAYLASDFIVAHHVLPLEAIKAFPELMDMGARGGFDINGPENGSPLLNVDHVDWETEEYHKKYNDFVFSELRRINSADGLSPAEAADLLRGAANSMRNAISNRQYLPGDPPEPVR